MTRKTEAASQPVSFENAIEELEAIVRAMEDGKLPLDSALERYQRGVELVRHCQSTLNTAEQKVRMLEDGLLRDFPGDAGVRGDE
jgi:exodeoxyribonuclease VII small subunit